MKKSFLLETEDVGTQNNLSKSVQERINQVLRDVHLRMVELFNVDFTFFKSFKLLRRQEFQNQLAQRIQDDLKESGIESSGTQLGQITQVLARDQATGVSEHFAFYNLKNDTLYLNEDMAINYPEKVVSVCAHELAEKLLSTYISLPSNSSMRSAVKLYLEVKNISDPERLQQILDIYFETIFKAVFKEGACEAIAVHVMRNMNYATEAAILEEELQEGYTKCSGLLSRIENIRKNVMTSKVIQLDSKVLDEQVIVEEVLKNSQIIKGVSYYLGYPLARVVLEKYGLYGIRFIVENALPLKAEYFSNPESYLVTLDKILSK